MLHLHEIIPGEGYIYVSLTGDIYMVGLLIAESGTTTFVCAIITSGMEGTSVRHILGGTMNYLSFAFLGFFTGFVVIYYLLPAKYRYIAIFLGSYIFYGFGHPKMLLTLVGLTLISYIGGLLLEKNHSKNVFAISLLLEIVVLVVFKYTGFLLQNYNSLVERIHPALKLNMEWNILLPVGLSFIVFQTCAYLSDVYRGKFKAERNLIRYAAYAAFFPTVLSGPIQKARVLIPQIKEPRNFDVEQALKGTILFVWGVFEKVLVANNLNVIVTRILDEYSNHTSMELLIAACCFSFYIYADFSSYSDMSRGIAKLLNIDVGRNFSNPYVSRTTAEFWNRWHMSLNEWFIENVYIPLGGNRKGKVRKYINILIVFFISGLWHGAQWHYVIWGILNGVFVVIGQMIAPVKKKIYKVINVSEETESIVFIKQFIVFGLITMTWMFFHAGIRDALGICKRIMLFDFVSVFHPDLMNISGTAVETFATTAFTIFFCRVQLARQNEASAYARYMNQPFLIQCFIVAILICICIFGACNTNANVDAAFLYFQF